MQVLASIKSPIAQQDWKTIHTDCKNNKHDDNCNYQPSISIYVFDSYIHVFVKNVARINCQKRLVLRATKKSTRVIFATNEDSKTYQYSHSSTARDPSCESAPTQHKHFTIAGAHVQCHRSILCSCLMHPVWRLWVMLKFPTHSVRGTSTVKAR